MVEDLVRWFAVSARDLPWRRPGVSPYGVLVSEVMLQQTPVARVVPAWEAWLERWPTAASLASAPSGEAVRMWGRLGYPRRALRLHAACVAVTELYGGDLPLTLPELLALPGVGDYTARAVAAFAHRQRHPVVDTNVRRVVARLHEGVEDAAVTKKDLALVEALLPEGEEEAAVASIAFMELGALVCTARAPRCGVCPVRGRCAWLAAGSPPGGPVRKAQGYRGPTGRCAVGCSGSCGTRTDRSRPSCSTRCGTSPSSGLGPSTAWWPTASSTPSPTGCSLCRGDRAGRSSALRRPPGTMILRRRADLDHRAR